MLRSCHREAVAILDKSPLTAVVASTRCIDSIIDWGYTFCILHFLLE